MSATALCLLGLIAWALVLTLLLLGARTFAMLKGHAVNTFTQDGAELAAFGQRVTRAHGNTLEWLAIPLGLLLYAEFAGLGAVTDGLALVFLGARVAQSIAHLISTSAAMVLVRATFFTVQQVISIVWVVRMLG
ncbi:MAG: MAPEG family protein [Gammaproteobacteria bacterium]